jgi:hypothetical protein
MRGKTAVTNRSKASANHRAHGDYKSLYDYHILFMECGQNWPLARIHGPAAFSPRRCIAPQKRRSVDDQLGPC